LDSEPDLREPIKTGKKRRSSKAETAKKTMVIMLATMANAIFASVSIITRQDHWNLEPQESNEFAIALNDALSTLPTKAYEAISKLIESYAPWLQLCFVTYAIVMPRIKESNKRNESAAYRTRQEYDARNGRTTPDNFDSFTSLGGNI
jgi:hypothetical protein